MVPPRRRGSFRANVRKVVKHLESAIHFYNGTSKFPENGFWLRDLLAKKNENYRTRKKNVGSTNYLLDRNSSSCESAGSKIHDPYLLRDVARDMGIYP